MKSMVVKMKHYLEKKINWDIKFLGLIHNMEEYQMNIFLLKNKWGKQKSSILIWKYSQNKKMVYTTLLN